METNTLLKQFKDECQVIEFKYEYPGYVGYEQYGIITELSESELNDKYKDITVVFRRSTKLSYPRLKIRFSGMTIKLSIIPTGMCWISILMRESRELRQKNVRHFFR